MVGVPGYLGEHVVKAVVVAREACQEQEIVDFCRDRLADLKIPRLGRVRQRDSPERLRKNPTQEPDVLIALDIAELENMSAIDILARLNGFDVKSLDPLQRVLLVTDGTLTEILEANFFERIRLVKVSRE